MVWGYLQGLGSLLPVKGNVNAAAHRHFTQLYFSSFGQQLGEELFLFQHDDAPVHKLSSMKT